MKKNKVIIPLLATVAGLSIVGGIGGAVAWYQYNTRVNASFIGSSVAESGVLQIRNEGGEWGRDAYYKGDPTLVQNFSPVTFGYTLPGEQKVIHANDPLPNNDTTSAGRTIAFAYPEAGKGDYSYWTQVTPGKEFVSYKIYLRALEVDTLPSAEDQFNDASKEVFLSQVILDGNKKMTGGENPTYNEEIQKALRLHLSVKDGSTTKNFLISRGGDTVDLYSNTLDLDADGKIDEVGGMAWEHDSTPVMYGNENATCESYSISEIVASKDANGDFDFTPSAEEIAAGLDTTEKKHNKQLICTTHTDHDIEITVTVWLEGWSELQGKDSHVRASHQPSQAEFESAAAGTYFVKSGDEFVAATAYDAEATYYVVNHASALWDPRVTASETNFLSTLHVGMTFDVGKNAFKKA